MTDEPSAAGAVDANKRRLFSGLSDMIRQPGSSGEAQLVDSLPDDQKRETAKQLIALLAGAGLMLTLAMSREP